MEAMDKVNKTLGKEIVRLSVQGDKYFKKRIKY